MNDNGRIDNGTELFGNATRWFWGGTAANGFEALAQYDTPALGGNNDGFISAQDFNFPRLRVWVDGNHNGDTDPGELLTLADAGVIRINLKYSRSHRQDGNGNLFRFKSKAWIVGRNGRPNPTTTWDVFFATAP